MNGHEETDPHKRPDHSDHPHPRDTSTEVPLRQGEQGEAVLRLQEQLLTIGYHDMDRALRCDGEFGDRTRRAVEAFQYDYGLTIDGIVGRKTSNALRHAAYAHRFSSMNKYGTKHD